VKEKRKNPALRLLAPGLLFTAVSVSCSERKGRGKGRRGRGIERKGLGLVPLLAPLPGPSRSCGQQKKKGGEKKERRAARPGAAVTKKEKKKKKRRKKKGTRKGRSGPSSARRPLRRSLSR